MWRFGRGDLGTLEPPSAPAPPKRPVDKAQECLRRGQKAAYTTQASCDYLEGLLILALDARRDDVV